MRVLDQLGHSAPADFVAIEQQLTQQLLRGERAAEDSGQGMGGVRWGTVACWWAGGEVRPCDLSGLGRTLTPTPTPAPALTATATPTLTPIPAPTPTPTLAVTWLYVVAFCIFG